MSFLVCFFMSLFLKYSVSLLFFFSVLLYSFSFYLFIYLFLLCISPFAFLFLSPFFSLFYLSTYQFSQFLLYFLSQLSTHLRTSSHSSIPIFIQFSFSLHPSFFSSSIHQYRFSVLQKRKEEEEKKIEG